LGRHRGLFGHVAAMLGVVVVLLSPMYFTSRGFGPDWTFHLWVLWVQGAHISNGDGPRLFFDSGTLGSFFPWYAFYGGTLYTLGGGLSALLRGHAIVAYMLMWTLAFCMAYGGLLWLSLQAGLRGWRAHAAPLVLVTSAYYVTNAYARGVWPELTATSSLMLVIAGGVHLLRAERLRALPTAVFLLAVTIFTGSHNITLVWGTVTLAALVLVAIVALPRRGLEIGVRRVAAVGGLAVLGAAVNAWFLLPDLSYAQRTLIAKESALNQTTSYFGDSGVGTGPFSAPGNVLTPLRHTPRESTTPDLFVQLPVFAVIWVIVFGALALRHPVSEAWRRFIAGTAVICAVLLLLLMTDWPWHHGVPRLLTYVQFKFRLETYILLCLALLVIALLVWLRRAAPGTQRPAYAALACVLAVGAGFAVWQAWHTPSVYMPDRHDTFVSSTQLPKTAYDLGTFRDQSQRIVAGASDTPQVIIPPDPGARDRTVVVPTPAGLRVVTTNLLTGPYLVDVEGAKPIGRTPSGWLVLRRPKDQVAQTTMRLRLSTAESVPVVAGRWMTRLALIGVVAVLVMQLLQSRRRRGQRRLIGAPESRAAFAGFSSSGPADRVGSDAESSVDHL
jgi:hypothetical protein